MNKKVLIISSSPRKGGNSETVFCGYICCTAACILCSDSVHVAAGTAGICIGGTGIRSIKLPFKGDRGLGHM